MLEQISHTSTQLPHVVLVGRTNVGKSTLFNRIIEEHKALTSDIPGTTRTNNEGTAIWRGKQIYFIDTGGLDNEKEELFGEQIMIQAESALRRADIIIMVTDARAGLLPQEKNLVKKLFRQYKDTVPIILIANKADNQRIKAQLNDPEWLKLGLGKPLAISAANGTGIGDLLDYLFKLLHTSSLRPKKLKAKAIDGPVRVSIVGKPNVGKSSLFNKIIGEERVIVSNIAHTTREPYDTTVTYTGPEGPHQITFIDTAGIRRKSHVTGELEQAGIQKTIKSIESSDIILLILDGSDPISAQDMQLGGLLEKRSKGVIIIINKWDLTDDNTDQYRNDVKKMIHAHFPHLDFAPILFVSGKTGYRVHQIFPLIITIARSRKTEIPQSALDTFIINAAKQHKPSRGKGTRQPELKRLHQVHANPPIFELYIKHNTSLHRSYIKYLENRLREQFDFIGTPLVIKLTKSKK